MIPPEKIDEIREANNIVDVVSSYIPLKKSGSNYKACCPFHEEKTPSFSVSEPKQIYKCFGCGKTGNVITFVRDYEHVSFVEAVKKLAARAAITLPSLGNKAHVLTKKDKIVNTYRIAKEFFCQNLTKNGLEARTYLTKRQISAQTIKKFELGYALNSYRGLQSYLQGKKSDPTLWPETGLIGQNEKGQYDLFRDRLMFPIHNATGKVVAFGGRLINPEAHGGKYLNSPTTPIYTKGQELYGLCYTKYDISKQDYVIICEGYMDFLRLYESGFHNTVASLGTALTSGQISLLSRFTHNFYMLYDGDKAGKAAAMKAAAEIIKAGYNVRVVDLPEGMDPDDFILKKSAQELEEKIQNAGSLTTCFFNDESLKLPTRTKLSRLSQLASTITDGISRELFIKEISEVFGVSDGVIKEGLQPVKQALGKREKEKINKFPEEKELLVSLLNNSLKIKEIRAEIDETYLMIEIYRNLYSEISKLENISDVYMSAGQLIERLDGEARSLAGELLLDETPLQSVSEILKHIKLRKCKQDLQKMDATLRKNISNSEEFNKLLTQKKVLQKQIALLNDSLRLIMQKRI